MNKSVKSPGLIKYTQSKQNTTNPSISVSSSDVTPSEEFKNEIAAKPDYYWAEGALDAYVGEYIASPGIPKGSKDKVPNSWANVSPDPRITAERVDSFDIEKALEFAKSLDGDIDGLNNNATSSFKEGSESFVYGADYSGTQGIRISEVSGLSATYVRGQRVSWTDGDFWNCQKGGSSCSEANVKDMNSVVNATKVESKITSDTLKSFTYVKGDNTSIRFAGGNVNSINIGGTTNESIIFTGCVNAYIGGAKCTFNLGGIFGVFQVVGCVFDYQRVFYKYTNTTVGGVVTNSLTAPAVISSTNAEEASVHSNLTNSIAIQCEIIGKSTSKIDSEISIIADELENVNSKNSNIRNSIARSNTLNSKVNYNFAMHGHNILKSNNNIENTENRIVSNSTSVNKIGLMVIT